MSDGGMIVGLLNTIDSLSHSFVFQGYQNLVSSYKPAIEGLIVLALIVFGYGSLTGWISLSLEEISKRALLFGFVLSFALNWGHFSEFIYKLFTVAPNEVASHLVQSLPGNPFTVTGGVNQALQEALYDLMNFFNAIWDQGGISNLMPYVWAVLLLIIGLILMAIALIELVVAKFGLAIYLVLAPLIIPMLLFKATKEAIFDGWLRHLIGLAFIPIFITSALSLGLMLMAESDSAIKSAIAADQLTITAIAPHLISCLVCIGLLLKATAMAASLASGFSTASAQWAGDKAQQMGSWTFKKIFGEKQ